MLCLATFEKRRFLPKMKMIFKFVTNAPLADAFSSDIVKECTL